MSISNLSQSTIAKIQKMDDSLALWEARFNYGQSLLFGSVQLVAPALVPLAPAAFVGFEVWEIAEPVMGVFAIPVGIIAAFGLEAVGFTASHTTLRLFEFSQKNGQGRGKFWLGSALVLTYMVTAMLVIIFSQQYTYVAVGVGMVILAVINYISQGLTAWVRWAETNEEKTQSKEEQREAQDRQDSLAITLKQMELDQQKAIELGKARTSANVEKARIKAELSAERPPDKPDIRQTSAELPADYLNILRTMKNEIGQSEFSANDLSDKADIGRTKAYEIINAGSASGIIYQAGRGRYIINGIEEVA